VAVVKPVAETPIVTGLEIEDPSYESVIPVVGAVSVVCERWVWPEESESLSVKVSVVLLELT
jgi:hypothetical protein